MNDNIEVQPRLVTAEYLAARFGKKKSWFHEHKEHLYGLGMPRPARFGLPNDKRAEMYDLDAWELWMDNRSGIDRPNDPRRLASFPRRVDPFLQGSPN